MLSRLKVENIKSIDKAELDLGRFNVFVGPNSSGKSSIIQLLALVRQAYEARNEEKKSFRFNGDLVAFNDFSDIARKTKVSKTGMNHNSRSAIELKFKTTASEASSLQLSLKEVKAVEPPRELAYRLEFDPSTYVDDFLPRHTATIDNAVLFELWQQPETKDEITAITNQGRSEFIDNFFEFTFGKNPLDFEIGGFLKNACKLFEKAVGERLKKIYPLFSQRGVPSHTFELLPQKPLEVCNKDPVMVSQKTANILMYGQGRDEDQEMLDRVNKWTSSLFGVTMRAILEADKRMSISTRNTKGLQVNVANEGYGLSQMLPILTQCTMAPQGSLVLIEEPEAHLHPRTISSLIKFFIEQITKEDKQIILTTFSEHLLLDLQRAVAAEAISWSDVAIHYFDVNSQCVKVSKIELDESGKFNGELPPSLVEDMKEFRRASSVYWNV